ncbi:MAG: PAS domain S-box protein [Acetobacteraceae bacterium]|nr:PAS domain S-box protein [Acetobacteraceae bacterium]
MPEDSRSALPDVDPIRAFAEGSPSAILLLGGLAHRILYANPAFCEAAGRPAAELIGRTAREAFPSLAAAGHLALFDQVRGSGAARRHPGLPLHLYPDGPLRFWDVEVVPVQDRDGATCGLLAQLRDVTAQQTALREGEAARATLDALFDHIPEGLILADAPAAAVVRVSAHGLRLAGRAAEEVLRRAGPAHVAAWEILGPDGKAARPEDLPLTRAVRRGEQVQQETWMVRHRDGRLIPILCSAGPIRDAGGRITGGILAWRDITDLRQAEAALAASEERFRTLGEAMPHLILQTDARGEPNYINRRAQDYTGRDLAAMRNGGWLSTLHPEDMPLLARTWGVALAGGGDYDLDARIRGADGGYRWFRVRGAPVRDAKGAIRNWVGTCTDVEDQHRAEAALHEAMEAQKELVREAEHRIKNSLQLVAALMRLQAGRLEETEARTALEAATARVQAVAEAHRALQKSPDLRSVRLADMLRELAAGVSVQHPGADLRIEAPEGLMLDAERAIPLALILAELAGKALRHGLAGPVCLSARIAEGTLLMEVTEPGRGAPEIGPAAELGEKVISMLARQIGARVSAEPAADGSRTALVMELERTTAALS